MDRLERMLWKINYKLDVLLDQSSTGLKETVRQEIVDILYKNETPPQAQEE